MGQVLGAFFFFSDGGRTREGHASIGGCIGRLKPNPSDMTSFSQCIARGNVCEIKTKKKIEFASDTGSLHVTADSETPFLQPPFVLVLCRWVATVVAKPYVIVPTM